MELNKELCDKQNPMTSEEREALEEEFDKEEAKLRNIAMSRTEDEKAKIREFVRAIFDPIITQRGY